MIIHSDGSKREELRQEWCPVRIMDSYNVDSSDELLVSKPASISFQLDHCAQFNGAGSWILLDFGKELCGSVRILTRAINNNHTTKWRITFGESASEACSSIGEKNATNDHSPRDFEMMISNMSDQIIGQTGFRFVRLELLEDVTVLIQSIFAVSVLPALEREATIVTNDSLVNDIINTAAYTLKLNFQNGYVWDGIKRDRLVWCGDLHPEILTSLYIFGDTPNIQNSLDFLRESTPADQWVNGIPTYSAWWVINLCDYCNITGRPDYYTANRDYALKVMEHINSCIAEDGTLLLDGNGSLSLFLDWSTHETPDEPYGVASQLRFAAMKFLEMEENTDCRDILRKLECYLDHETTRKPVRAFQVLAGRNHPEADAAMLQAGGAKDMSTFLSYYILSATASAGGTDMLDMLKSYYGGMLSRGATSFWEDFDIEWLEGSSRIDELPKPGEKDLHGDYGRYCYTQLRHSLCHGWSSGVLAFIIEYIVGIKIADGGKIVTVQPHLLGLTDIDATIPMSNGELKVSIHDGQVNVTAPEGTKVN